MDYQNDRYGRECLEEARKSKADIGFGALLVRNGKVVGRGYNRRSTPKERQILSHVDYAIHAEQACIVDALRRRKGVTGGEIYVLGIVLHGPRKGTLTTRRQKVFICKKCPHTLKRFNIPVNIPHVRGWVRLKPQQAEATSNKLCGNGYWRKLAGVRSN